MPNISTIVLAKLIENIVRIFFFLESFQINQPNELNRKDEYFMKLWESLVENSNGIFTFQILLSDFQCLSNEIFKICKSDGKVEHVVHTKIYQHEKKNGVNRAKNLFVRFLHSFLKDLVVFADTYISHNLNLNLSFSW